MKDNDISKPEMSREDYLKERPNLYRTLDNMWAGGYFSEAWKEAKRLEELDKKFKITSAGKDNKRRCS